MLRRATLACLLALLSCTPEDPGPPVGDGHSAEVSPFIGTGGFGYSHGSAFVGAVAPQGLAKVGPDTSGPWGEIAFLHYSGYWYRDDKIQGFSHLHLHGAGLPDYGVLSAMPTPSFDGTATGVAALQSTFAKSSEVASPGYYAVTLDRGTIRAELAATPRAAHHRYTFAPGAAEGIVVLDLAKHLVDGKIGDAELHLDPDARHLRGRLHASGAMTGNFGGYDLFFAAQSRAPWIRAQLWQEGVPPTDGTEAQGREVGCALRFDTTSGAPVELQVGLSLVSPEGAEANLAAELPAFDFEGTRAATAAAWERLTGAIRVTGGTVPQRNAFVSALYHAFLMPTVMNDVDGAYRAPDGSIGHAQGFSYVSDMSLWDSYRTVHPLYALIAPERAADAARSLVEMAKASGGRFPRWPIATGESRTMLGSSADVVIADAILRGAPGIDAPAAYALLRRAALDPTPMPEGRGSREPAEGYFELGYVPARDGRAVSTTTEMAHDDFALAELATALGELADAEVLRARSRGYRQLFDPASGFLWAKDAAGRWASSHADPLLWADEFAEANAAQSVWMAAHDADGLAQLFGGPTAMVDKLSGFFEDAQAELEATRGSEVNKGLPRPYYWHGNEPDIHAPYLFAQVGRPELTQKWVRWALGAFYDDSPDGLPGNDDGGTLSSWYVWSAIGLYPLPGSDRLIVGTPLFERAELQLPGGVFTIEAPRASGRTFYVQSLTLDGVPLERPELRQDQLRPGGRLVFVLGDAPGTWGR